MTKSERKEITKRYNNYRDNLLDALRYLVRSPLVNKFEGIRANCSTNEELLAQAQRRDQPQWYVDINDWRIPIHSKDVCGAPGQANLLVEGYISTRDFPLLK